MNPEHVKATASLLLATAAMVGAVDLRDISRAADMASRNNQILADMFAEVHTKAGAGVEIATRNQQALERIEAVLHECKRGK